MKKANIGIFMAAMLIAAAGAGFGIAQAEAGAAANMAWTLQDQEAVEQYQDYAVGPVGRSGSAGSMTGEGWQTNMPIGAGAVPGAGAGDSRTCPGP